MVEGTAVTIRRTSLVNAWRAVENELWILLRAETGSLDDFRSAIHEAKARSLARGSSVMAETATGSPVGYLAFVTGAVSRPPFEDRVNDLADELRRIKAARSDPGLSVAMGERHPLGLGAPLHFGRVGCSPLGRR